MYFPKHLQIETINGVCSAHCSMCTIDQWQRKPHVMSIETFGLILDKFLPYQMHLQYLTLHFCGEPLLDVSLPEKVRLAKEKGFKGTGFATNCTHLSAEMAERLLQAGLDTIICSIDGVTKATHESIRSRTNFDEIVQNVQHLIRLRNAGGETKILIRFIRQEKNRAEFEAYQAFWEPQLNRALGDGILVFDVHNWGEKLSDYESMQIKHFIESTKLRCDDVYSRMIVYSNGDVGLCCADDNGFYPLGNVLETDPIAIYNNDIFTRFRRMMDAGKLYELPECQHCSIPISRFYKKNFCS